MSLTNDNGSNPQLNLFGLLNNMDPTTAAMLLMNQQTSLNPFLTLHQQPAAIPAIFSYPQLSSQMISNPLFYLQSMAYVNSLNPALNPFHNPLQMGDFQVQNHQAQPVQVPISDAVDLNTQANAILHVNKLVESEIDLQLGSPETRQIRPPPPAVALISKPSPTAAVIQREPVHEQTRKVAKSTVLTLPPHQHSISSPMDLNPHLAQFMLQQPPLLQLTTDKKNGSIENQMVVRNSMLGQHACEEHTGHHRTKPNIDGTQSPSSQPSTVNVMSNSSNEHSRHFSRQMKRDGDDEIMVVKHKKPRKAHHVPKVPKKEIPDEEEEIATSIPSVGQQPKPEAVAIVAEPSVNVLPADAEVKQEADQAQKETKRIRSCGKFCLIKGRLFGDRNINWVGCDNLELHWFHIFCVRLDNIHWDENVDGNFFCCDGPVGKQTKEGRNASSGQTFRKYKKIPVGKNRPKLIGAPHQPPTPKAQK